MKKIILFVVLIFIASVGYSQDMNFLPANNYSWVKYVPKTYIHGAGTLLLEVRNLTVDTTGSGQCFLTHILSTGKTKRQYLGWYVGKNEIQRDFSLGLDSIRETLNLSTNTGLNPGFDELTSELRLRNTIFFSKDTTQAWTWIIKYQFEKVYLPDWVATMTRESYK